MFVKFHSPIASPLTVASKKTPLWVRIAANHININKYIQFGHYPIPNVQRTLEKLKGYEHFLEYDGYNMCHQLKYDEETSNKLSVQTVWEEYRPRFVLEDVAPATAVLQKKMDEMFGDLGEWFIPISTT